MTDYVKLTDFAAKDNLLTGNPLKLVKGAEIGAEFDAIATAVATKENTVNKSTTLDTDKASDIKFPSVKSVYDWAVGLFAPKTSPTLTGTVTMTGASITGSPTAALGATTVTGEVTATNTGRVGVLGGVANNSGAYTVVGGSSSNKNWWFGGNVIAAGAFEIGQTSAAGGITRDTASIAAFTSTGLAVTGTVSATTLSTIQSLRIGAGGGSPISNNSLFGYNALTVTSAVRQYSTAVGAYAAENTADANYNTAIGGFALRTNILGQNNTAIGANALFLSTGGNNIALGYGAGSAITTGALSVVLGTYDGNSDGLDIRTVDAYCVLSDGQGRRQITVAEGKSLALDSAVPVTGTGITFPATQNASADANTLDDYEEGTWTPTIRFGAASVGQTYAVQSGTYTKIGNVVHIEARLQFSNKGSSTGACDVSGLPFSAKTVSGSGSGGITPFYWSTFTTNAPLQGTCIGSIVGLNSTGTTTVTSITDANFGNVSAIYFSATYTV